MVQSFETVRLHVADGVATLTLNRPDRLNSFTTAMHGEVRAAIDAVVGNPEVRCFVLTGAGRGFCAGQDLSDRAVAPGQAVLERAEVRERVQALEPIAALGGRNPIEVGIESQVLGHRAPRARGR